MKFPSAVITALGSGLVAMSLLGGTAVLTNADMVKMCLFYGNESGHARTDPIISQDCASDHVHTVSELKKNERATNVKW